MLSGTDLLIGLTIILVGATVMGTFGFGLGLVTVPVLMVLVDPQSVVVIVNGSIAILMPAPGWRANLEKLTRNLAE